MPKSKAESTQKKGVTRQQLAEMVAEAASSAVEACLQDTLKGFKEEQSNIMERIVRNVNLGDEESRKGLGAARCLRALAFGRNVGGGLEAARSFAQKAWDDDLGKVIQKALGAGDFDAGGFLVPQMFVNEIIELLRARSVVRAAGARSVPMPGGSLTLPKQTSGAAAIYEGENQGGGAVTQPGGGQIVLTSKKLKAIVPVSNDFLQFSAGDSADEFIRDDLVAALATREDQAFLRDDGSENKPKGMRFWAVAGNIIASQGTTLAFIRADVNDLVSALENADVRMIRPTWFMSPRSKNFLMFEVVDADGRQVFESQLSAGQWQGFPVFVTNNLPNNLGGGSDESEVYLVDMADAIIGDVSDLSIVADSSAAYTESGSLVSAFERDQTVMRAISKHDFAMRHDQSIGVKTGVQWGA